MSLKERSTRRSTGSTARSPPSRKRRGAPQARPGLKKRRGAPQARPGPEKRRGAPQARPGPEKRRGAPQARPGLKTPRRPAPPGEAMVRHFLDLAEIDAGALRLILDESERLKRVRRTAAAPRPLAGKALAMIFDR